MLWQQSPDAEMREDGTYCVSVSVSERIEVTQIDGHVK